jgi:hypothetical protein
MPLTVEMILPLQAVQGQEPALEKHPRMRHVVSDNINPLSASPPA